MAITSPEKNWVKTKLGNVAEDIRILVEPTETEKYPYIGLQHIEQQSLRLNEIGASTDTISTKKVFQKGDILFGSLRPYFRKVVRPGFDGVCSTDITVIRAKEDTDTIFLYYFIANQEFIDHATNISTGTRMPRANWKVLCESEWFFPPLSTQRKIAAILSAYDDLIESNLRRIKILEEMAQALYREWFVHFRFPSHEKVRFVDSPLGKIPEGWEAMTVGDLLVKFKRRKRIKMQDYLAEGPIPVVDQGKEDIGGYTSDIIALHKEPLPVIVFGDHTRVLKYIDFPFASGADGTQLLVSNSSRMPMPLFYYSLKSIDQKDYAYARHFKWLKEEQIVVPEKKTSELFSEKAGLLRGLISKLHKTNAVLMRTRDLLLPKLISGELDVLELDITIPKDI